MRHTHTNTAALLEVEKETRLRAIHALRDLAGVHSLLQALTKEQDRKSYRDERYRRGRPRFALFMRRLSGNQRSVTSALGLISTLTNSEYISPEDLISEVQREDDALQARKDRRVRSQTHAR